MKNQMAWLLVLMMAGTGLAHAAESAKDRTGVMAAVDQFYAALNTMFTGDAGPMKDIWSTAAMTPEIGRAHV